MNLAYQISMHLAARMRQWPEPVQMEMFT